VRGLTLAERAVLAPASIAEALSMGPTDWLAIRIALWKQGRLSSAISGGPTDLGRLALRVCPAGEP